VSALAGVVWLGKRCISVVMPFQYNKTSIREILLSKKIMLINATDPEEIRVAVLKDGLLSDFDIEFIHNEKIKGNIYKAKVIRVDASLQAGFVHYGGQKNGFLPIAELPRDMVSPDGRRGRIQDLLHKDQEIMVQVIREELGTKGAMVTAQISLPGRYLVLTPGNAVNGISRKIEGREEREHFKRLVDELEIPSNMGVIVRTASLGVTREDFERDLDNLVDTYKEVLALYKKRNGVGLVWQEDDVVTRTLRDTWTPDIEEVHIDDGDTFQAAQNFFHRTMPQHLSVLRLYAGKKPIFSKFQTEEQIDRIYARRVPLPSGGAIVLDQTEALVAIDVNSGKTVGDNQEDTALCANLEAAEAIATQLRLRDLAGLIAIDFIDMKRETNNKAVMDRLVECLRMDKARMEVGKINRFGVLVMTRQRIRPSIQHVTHETCPVCQGTGQIKNSESLVLSVLRRLKSVLSKNSVIKIQLKLSPIIAMNLLNQRRSELAELEVAHEATIVVVPDHDITYGEVSLELTRKDDEPEHPKRHETPEFKREAEDETVVLGGDAPISFDKALANNKGNGQNNRRGAQRAALDERERLRSLFESTAPKLKAEPRVSDDSGNKRQRPVEEVAEPPKLAPEVIASLAVPTIKPRKLHAPSVESKVPPSLPEMQTGSAAEKTEKSAHRTKVKASPKPKEPDLKVSRTPKAAASSTSKSSAAKATPKPSVAESAVKAKTKAKATPETKNVNAAVAAKPKKPEVKPKASPAKPLSTTKKAKKMEPGASEKAASSVSAPKKTKK